MLSEQQISNLPDHGLGTPDRTLPADQPVVVTRSEEQLDVRTVNVPVGRARLERFQVTEMKTITVPVTREDVRVVYEPLEPGDTDRSAPHTFTSGGPWVLTEERIVVTKDIVPVEIVQLVVDTVTEQRQVDETVRKEQVDIAQLDNEGLAQLLLEQGVVISSGGEQIGKIGQVFADIQTGRLNWVTVRTGWFGAGESFVPLNDATISGAEVRVPYDKETIKGARHQVVDGELTEQDEDDLYAYYGIGIGTGPSEIAPAAEIPVDDAQGVDGVVSGASGVELIRSQEQLVVSTQRVEAGRTRLRKYVVTEQQSRVVPTAHDEVRVAREPITDANRDRLLGGGRPDVGEQVVLLTEDRVVVNKETVPVERITVHTHTVLENQTITEPVRKEQIEFDDSGLRAAGE